MDNAIGTIVGIIFAVGLVVAYFYPLVKILNRTGYSGWWSLIVLVPVVNIVMLWVFAFAEWPAVRETPRQ